MSRVRLADDWRVKATDKLLDIARALNLSLDYLMTGEDAEKIKTVQDVITYIEAHR